MTYTGLADISIICRTCKFIIFNYQKREENYCISIAMLYRLVAFSKGGRFSKNTNNGVLKQSVYIDFGKNNGLDGNVTEGPDQNGHYWNNAIETEYGETLELVSGTNESTGFIMEITKKFWPMVFVMEDFLYRTRQN